MWQMTWKRSNCSPVLLVRKQTFLLEFCKCYSFWDAEGKWITWNVHIVSSKYPSQGWLISDTTLKLQRQSSLKPPCQTNFWNYKCQTHSWTTMPTTPLKLAWQSTSLTLQHQTHRVSETTLTNTSHPTTVTHLWTTLLDTSLKLPSLDTSLKVQCQTHLCMELVTLPQLIPETTLPNMSIF